MYTLDVHHQLDSDFLQMFLQGNSSLTTMEQMAAQADRICVSPEVLSVQFQAQLSGVYCWSWT